MIQIDVRMAWEQLSEILGEAVGDSLIDQIFHSFAWVNKLQALLYSRNSSTISGISEVESL